MKPQRISSEPILYTLAAIMAIGGMISAIMTADTRWMQWHLSRLGEGGHLSSYVFNTSCALSSLLMGTFARRLSNDITLINAPQGVMKKARRILRVGLGIVAVCMMGVAVFPYDRFPLVHDVFGYSMTIIFVGLIAWLPLILPILTKFFMGVTYTFIIIMAILFAVYFATNQHTPHLIYIEILGLLFFFVWVMVLLRSIRVHNRKH